MILRALLWFKANWEMTTLLLGAVALGATIFVLKHQLVATRAERNAAQAALSETVAERDSARRSLEEALAFADLKQQALDAASRAAAEAVARNAKAADERSATLQRQRASDATLDACLRHELPADFVRKLP